MLQGWHQRLTDRQTDAETEKRTERQTGLIQYTPTNFVAGGGGGGGGGSINPFNTKRIKPMSLTYVTRLVILHVHMKFLQWEPILSYFNCCQNWVLWLHWKNACYLQISYGLIIWHALNYVHGSCSLVFWWGLEGIIFICILQCTSNDNRALISSSQFTVKQPWILSYNSQHSQKVKIRCTYHSICEYLKHNEI